MPDSLVAKWLVRPLAAATVATVGTSGGLPTSVGETTTTTTAGTQSVQPTKLGINLMEPDWSATSRAFSNLVNSSYWGIQSGNGDPVSAYVDSSGRLIRAGAGDNIGIALNKPNGVFRGKPTDIVCRYDGKATMQIFNNGAAVNGVVRANEIRFTYMPVGVNAMLKVLTVDPTQPLSNLDCRETSASVDQFFDPEYLALLKKFNTIRFMDWQETNKNKAVTWATRSRLVGKNMVRGPDGFPIEVMIRLANETHTNPWFCIPWNADDDYVRKMAELVRDTLDPTLVAHVEMSNEIWNWYFSAAQQASTEGLAEGLSTDKGWAQVYRYAEKLGQGMDIWTQVFAGQMNRIVRVAAYQAVNPDHPKAILAFRTTASKVDAIAGAPYLDYGLDGSGVTTADLSPVFTQLQNRIAMHKANYAKIRTLATQYGKRVLTYEGGQHVLGQDVALQTAVQRDARMQTIYTNYLRWWQQDQGDLLMIYADYAAINKYGAWGMLENAGQLQTDTVKGKAVQLFQASISK